MGALPLRWQLERGWRVQVFTVTLGSKVERRAEREAELHHACGLLGWNCEILGWEGIAADLRAPDPAKVRALAGRIAEAAPQAIFFPHAADAHPAHIAVHHLTRAALAELTTPPTVFLTEFWQPMDAPNLLVEVPPSDLAILVEAMACHAGEVARNPYHRTLPAWMLDNVRRGVERVSGAGAQAPDFPFGVLYRAEPAPSESVRRAGPDIANQSF